VLDVLDPDAVGSPDEDRARVRRVDDALDDPQILRFRGVLLRRIDEHGQVVQQRPLRLAGITFVELDVGPTHFDARIPLLARLGMVEAEPRVLVGGLLRSPGVQGDMIEVVVDVCRRLYEPDTDALPELDLVAAPVRQLRASCVEIRDAQRNVLERAAVAWALCDEQRQLPAAGV